MRAFESDVWLPAPRDEVFAYFADARNLDRMTPPWFRLLIHYPEPPIRMERGTTIDYQMRWRRLSMRWRSEITAWDPPLKFSYQQRRGPYRSWLHEHRYAEEDGGTRVFDRVEYSTLLGDQLGRLVVEPDIARIFAHRNEYVLRLFERRNLRRSDPRAPVDGEIDRGASTEQTEAGAVRNNL